MKEKLALLEKANGYYIETKKDGWEVRSEDYPLMAFITGCGNIEYYRTDIYKVTGDLADIDLDGLLDLRAFCEGIVK